MRPSPDLTAPVPPLPSLTPRTPAQPTHPLISIRSRVVPCSRPPRPYDLPMTRTRLTVALALGSVLLTAGCGGEPSSREGSEPERQRPRAGAQISPIPTPSAKPRETREGSRGKARERRTVAPKPAAPEPTGNALTIQQTADAHLIGADALGARWSVEATGRESGRLTSDCQRATLRDIGAMQTRVRDFTADGSAAAQAVSRFGDAKSAWRAEQVMTAWRADCAEELRRRDAALGTVRHGAWLSVVEVVGLPQPRKRLRVALAAADATF